jgi:hypothetical protein
MVTRKLAWLLVLMALFLFLPASMFKGRGQDRVPGLKADEASSGGCSLATLQGTYGVWEQGTFVGKIDGNPPGIQVAIVGRVTYDGAGNLSGTWFGSFGGSVTPTLPVTGTYTVSPDCIYSDEFSPGGPGFFLHHSGPIVGEGKSQEVHYIYTDAGTVMSGTAQRAPRAD